MLQSVAETIAKHLVAARREGRALAEYPGEMPSALAAGYEVQDAGINRFGKKVGGWKVGRIFPPQSERLGCDRLAGPIFQEAIQEMDETRIPVGQIFAGGFAAAEAEYLFRIGNAPPNGQKVFSLEEAAHCVDAVHIGIEIASSPLLAINDLGAAVTVSDFGNNNGLIVGPEILDWKTSDFSTWDVSLSIDGVDVGRNSAAGFPDGPIGSVRFLLENLGARGITIGPGIWVSSGAITGVHKISAGQHVDARFGQNLGVECKIDVADKF